MVFWGGDVLGWAFSLRGGSGSKVGKNLAMSVIHEGRLAEGRGSGQDMSNHKIRDRDSWGAPGDLELRLIQ